MKTEEKQFLQVKEKLDYYRLPTIFNYEDVHLLSKLLSLLDKQMKKEGKEQSPHKISSTQLPQINDALRHQIGKVIKQNNKLHMDVVSCKQQILSLKYKNDKLLFQRSGGNKQNMMLIQIQRQRQNQLFQQLTQVKFKYNQLMDLVHEDPNIEKKYIKRLMKHRKMESNSSCYSVTSKKQQFSQKQLKRTAHQTVTDLEAKLILLQNKLANRQSQIARLHKRSQYDGLNMNKILRDFHQNRNDNRMNALNEQLQHLQDQNKKMKQQVSFCRKTGGLKQALREQMRKNHQTIKKLQSQNKQLKKKLNHKQFDITQQLKLKNIQVQKAQEQANHISSQSQQNKLIINNLNKKINFLNNQINNTKSLLNQQQKLSQQQNIVIDKLKNTKQGDKILAHYQVQSLKQKTQQFQLQIQNYQQKINELLAQNDYHKKQDKLKNQAIENLQKIVDELMKRNGGKGQQTSPNDRNSFNIQNAMALRKNLTQTKQQLVNSQNQKQKQQKQIQSLIRRLQHKSLQNNTLNEQLKQLKFRLIQLKTSQQQFQVIQQQLSVLQSDLKKQQNYRRLLQNTNQQLQHDRNKYRKQLQDLNYEFQLYQKKVKMHENDLKLSINQLQQLNSILEIKLKQKDKKIIYNMQVIEQINGKIKVLKNQITLLQNQKHSISRQKFKFQKKCQQLIKIKQQSDLEHLKHKQVEHNDILEYQHKIQTFAKTIANKVDQIQNLKSLYQALKLSQNNLLQQNINLKKQLLKQQEHLKKIYYQQQQNQ